MSLNTNGTSSPLLSLTVVVVIVGAFDASQQSDRSTAPSAVFLTLNADIQPPILTPAIDPTPLHADPVQPRVVVVCCCSQSSLLWFIASTSSVDPDRATLQSGCWNGFIDIDRYKASRFIQRFLHCYSYYLIPVSLSKNKWVGWLGLQAGVNRKNGWPEACQQSGVIGTGHSSKSTFAIENGWNRADKAKRGSLFWSC